MIYWRTDAVRFKFDSCVIFQTNHNSLLSTATNHFASFCIDYRLHQSAIFMSIKVAKFGVKRPFFSVNYNSLVYETYRFHVAVCLFSNRSQRTSKCGKNISDTRGALFCSNHILTSFVIYYWTDARQNGIYLLNEIHGAILLDNETKKGQTYQRV